MNFPVPSEKNDLSIEYYDNNVGKYIDDTIALDMSHLYKKFLQEIPQGSRILDAGCGSGRDSLFFMKHGYKVTGFDASAEMVKHASEVTGLNIKLMKFEDVNYTNEFEGIWACASLLHIPSAVIDDVLERLAQSLCSGGVLFASFKYGIKEEVRHGRLFNDFTEDKFISLISTHPKLEVISIWTTMDIRNDRKNEKWLNILLKKP